MASTPFFFSCSILLLLFIAIASAADIGYSPSSENVPNTVYSPTPKPETTKPNPTPKSDDVKPENEYSPKSKPENTKPYYSYSPNPNSVDVKLKADLQYGSKPNPDGVKPEDEYSPKSKPETVKPEDGHNKPKPKPESAKPQAEYKPKPDSIKPEDEPENDYNSKPKSDTEKPNNEYVQAPKPAPESNIAKPETGYQPKPESETKKSNDAYVPTPKLDKTKPENEYVPKPENEYAPKPTLNQPKLTVPKLDLKEPDYGDGHDQPKFTIPKPEIPLPVGIEGLVLCKSGSKYIPIEGAVARITCSFLGHDGYEAKPFSCLTGATDAKGYFFEELPNLGFGDSLKLTDCNVKLEKSPLGRCNVPTNVNKGITGALLNSYNILHDKKIKLYSVGPFFYTSDSDPKSTPIGY